MTLPSLPRRRFLSTLAAFGVATVAGGLHVTAPIAAQDLDPSQAPSPETYEPANWVRVPRIGVDSAVTEVGVTNGYYDVPWFGVGHHFDSANPGQPGNTILNGHVLTIDAGRVFYRLHELEPDDAVFVYTAGYRTGWAVTSVYSVPDGDDSFLWQTDAPRLTLYTCTGTFNPVEQSFSERLVVVADLAEVVPRA